MLKAVSSITNAIGALNYKGTWDANTNSPALASGVGTKGDYYVVSVAGTTTLDGISNWGIGDWAVFNGSVWQRVEGGADLNGVNLSVTGTTTLSGLTASTALALDASKNVVSVTNTGTGNNVLASSPSITSPTFATDTTHSYLTASSAVATDANKKLVSVTNTGTGNNVLGTSPSIATPTLTGNVSMTTGNLVVGTAGKGIDFSANTHSAGMTSELLTWYEEGTWTPTVSGASGTTYTTQLGWYTRVGNIVTVGFELTINSEGTITGGAAIAGLPFTSAATYKSSGSLTYAATVETSIVWQGLTIGASQSVLTIYIRTAASTSTTSINGSDFFANGTQIIGQMIYRV